MITRFKVLLVCIICTGLGVLGVSAAESSAKSFVEGIYAAYKGKDARGVSLESDAAVRRYSNPSSRRSSSRTARTRAARSASLTPIPSLMRRIGRSTP